MAQRAQGRAAGRPGLSSTAKTVAWMATLATILWLAPAAAAQSEAPATGKTEVKGVVGYAGFIDEDTLDHIVVGGAVRHYLTRRLAVEPELLYMRRDRRDQDLVILGNVVYEFRETERVEPFVVGGIGLLRHWSRFGERTFTATGLTYGGGVGFRFLVGDRWAVTPEARLGVEPFFRATVSIGYRLR